MTTINNWKHFEIDKRLILRDLDLLLKIQHQELNAKLSSMCDDRVQVIP